MTDAMRKIDVEKVTLNIGTGEPGAKLEKAKLSKLTGACSRSSSIIAA